MSYEGRSPINDVARSVLVGAAMISPALLAACAEPKKPITATPDPVTDADAGTTTLATSTASATASATATDDPAPDPTIVRPRTDPSGRPQMPTRGFSGAARVRA